ncbi:MAG: hypothetical protein NVSMB26_04680 [Beijerinckiaceae bacterium]
MIAAFICSIIAAWRRLGSAFVVAFSLAATPALAQQPAAPAPTGDASASQPTQEQIALGRDVVLYSGIARSFQIVIPQYLDQIGTTLTQTRPDLIRDLNVVMEGIKPDFDKKADEMVDTAARLYAQRLSLQELKDTAAFFKSPAGVKYVQAQPGLMNDLLPAMQAWSRQISTDMMTRVRAEMKKKGHDL